MEMAINWQHETRGVVGTGSIYSSRYKDKLTLHSIENRSFNTLALGSSTIMGLRTSHFPEHLSIFNGAKNRNTLPKEIAEARYYLDHFESIKNLVIGFDWGLDFSQDPESTDFNPRIVPKRYLTFFEMIADAVSTQRLKIVFANFYADLLKSTEQVYVCPNENSLGMDILSQSLPLACSGFRADGSATFASQKPVSENLWQILTSEAKTIRYRSALVKSQGKLGIENIDGLRALQKELVSRGGNLYILLPPVIPKLLDEIMQSEEGKFFKSLKIELDLLQSQEKIIILDTSRSSAFGCQYSEFLDAHHAYPECFEKAISAFHL